MRQTISEEMRRALQGASSARPMDDGTSEWSTPREPPSSVGAPRPPEPLGPPPKARGLASPPRERPPPRPLPKPVKKEAPDREKKPPKETAESSKPPEQAAPARGSKVKKEDSPTDTHKNPKRRRAGLRPIHLYLQMVTPIGMTTQSILILTVRKAKKGQSLSGRPMIPR